MMDAPLSMARDGVVVKHEPEVTVKLERDPIPAPLGFEVAIKPEPEPNNGALRHIAPPMGLRPEDAPKLAAVVKLEMAKVKADNPYVERVLLHRQLDIAKVCGGGGYCTFPHAASWRTDCAIEGHYVTMTLDWNVDLPSVAGQLTAAVRDLCPELEHKPFHLFVKRKDENGQLLGWEYCGRYERVPDCLPMELNPNPVGENTSKISAEAKEGVIKCMMKSEDRSYLLHWAERLRMNTPRTENEHFQVARAAVERQEFWTSVPIRFVDYDEELYDKLKTHHVNRTRPREPPAIREPGTPREPSAKRRHVPAPAATDAKRPRRGEYVPFTKGANVIAKFVNYGKAEWYEGKVERVINEGKAYKYDVLTFKDGAICQYPMENVKACD